MKPYYFLLIVLVTTIISCHKDAIQHTPPAGTPTVKLKDLNERNLPSPYYHFEYNDSGNITQAGFSAGMRIYHVNYNGKNIISMENTTDPNNNARLEYEYSNGDLIAVSMKDQNGITLQHCIISCSVSHQLQEIDWDLRDGNVGYYFEQSMTLSYYSDGNVMEIVTHNYPVGSQTEAIYTDRFENYDSHVNADGFTLVHTNPHELVLLPGIKFQINNPRRNIRTGDGINYKIEYTYTYDAKGRPTVKTGDVLFTNGSNAGQHFESQSTFSYYD